VRAEEVLCSLVGREAAAMVTVRAAGTAASGKVLSRLLLYWYKSTNTDAAEPLPEARCSVYLLYWYKSTNTDAAEAWRDGQLPLLPCAVPRALEKLELRKNSGHGRFTSFVGIPLQVTLAVRELLQQQGIIQFAGLAGTNIFSLLAWLVQKVRIPVCSCRRPCARLARCARTDAAAAGKGLSFLALLVQQCTY